MDRHKTLTRALSTLVLFVGLISQARAQTPAATFEELRADFKIKPKEFVELTDVSGTKYRARITAISERSISVIANGVRRDFLESDVRQIRHEKRDGLWNGAAFGALTGVGAAAVGVAAVCPNDPECGANVGLVFFPTFAGIGAGTGVLIDFLMRKNETVFNRQTITGSQGLRVAPIVGKKMAGAGVSFRF